MPNPRIFLSSDLAPNFEIRLTASQHHYLVKVLRQNNGDTIKVFNTKKEFNAVITCTKPNLIIKLTTEEQNISISNPLKIHLYQALLRSKKMDLIVQKATELGVIAITPMITARCQVRECPEKKLFRWQDIAIHASQQSQQQLVPQINDPIKLENIKITNDSFDIALIPSANSGLKSKMCLNKNINIFIGPEGGFSAAEEDYFTRNDTTLIKFGPRILRTETAPIAVIAAINALWGDSG